jgi:DNA repair protein RecO (recombination protein O)
MIARVPQKTEAIVLRLLDYGESDRIVTFCTPELGKLKGIAKGARRSRKRFANALEPFSRLEIQFSQRGADRLALIEGAQVLCHYPAIRADLEKTLMASYLIDLADQFALEGKGHETLFDLVAGFLSLFESEPAPETLLRFYEIRLLKLAGYDPALEACLGCRAPVASGGAYHFHLAAGGLYCSQCRPAGADTLPVSLGTIRTLQLCRDLEMDHYSRLVWSDTVALEGRRLLARFLRHILGKELKSVQVLNEIRKLAR